MFETEDILYELLIGSPYGESLEKTAWYERIESELQAAGTLGVLTEYLSEYLRLTVVVTAVALIYNVWC